MGYEWMKELVSLDSERWESFGEFLRDRDRLHAYRAHGMTVPDTYDTDFFAGMEEVFADELAAADGAYEEIRELIGRLADRIYTSSARRYGRICGIEDIPEEIKDDFRMMMTVYTIYHGFSRDHVTMGGAAARMGISVDHITFEDAVKPYLEEVREMEGDDLYEIIIECSTMVYEAVVDEVVDLVDELDFSDEVLDMEMKALYEYCSSMMRSTAICDAVERNSDGHLLDMMSAYMKEYDDIRKII